MKPTTHAAIDAAWRIESPRLIAALTRLVRDVGTAEDLAQDALVAALEQWPESGVPRQPGAWLMATAKHRAIDGLRHDAMARRQLGAIAHDAQLAADDEAVDLDARLDDFVGDDLLRLAFLTCHPVLAREARVALTLRLLGALTTGEIARAFLVSEATVAQRIVRAKRTLAAASVAFELPPPEQLGVRMQAVLEVVYLVFNEGYSAAAGADLVRPALCIDAMRLGRLLAGLAPESAEVHGLVALMELQASRTGARTDARGDVVPLTQQDRSTWDQLLIRRGLASLDRAIALGGSTGSYALQAAIAACHARARVADDTDWEQIAATYDALAQVAPNPVVELNRAVAHSMAFGPMAGLELLDIAAADPRLADYHLVPAARGDFLARLGRSVEAGAAFERAAAMTSNAPERAFLLRRAEACRQRQ